jgi:hypothetical protein
VTCFVFGVRHTYSKMVSRLTGIDAYLASDDMFALHCYVCVAILSTCKE